MTAGRDAGYAMIAAIVAAAGFALVSAEVVSWSRDAAVTAGAEATHARQEADAQAGIAFALDGLQADDPAARWSIGGEPRTLDFDDTALTIRIEDERGKIPLATISPVQASSLFKLVGVDPADLDAVVAAFLTRRSPPLRRAPSGVGATRDEGLQSLRELLLLPGMTPAAYAAIAPAATLDVNDAAFEPRTAPPLALEVMTGEGPGAPDVIARQRVLAGEAPALDTGPPLALAGRPLTIRVSVQDRRGDVLQRAEVVQLTRNAARPYVVRRLVADGPAADTP